MASVERLSILLTSIAAFAVVLAVDVLYVGLIASQDRPNPTPWVPFFIASYLLVMALVIAAAVIPRPEILAWRLPLRAAAAAGLLALGLLAAFSIGLPLVIAGILMLVALTRTRTAGGRWPGALGGAVAVAVLLAGFQLTEGLLL